MPGAGSEEGGPEAGGAASGGGAAGGEPADLASAIDRLYGLDPAEFTATRDAMAAAARKAGDRALAANIKGFKRPSAAAFTVNRLARSRPDELEQLIGLGEKLREAQESLAGDELRTLGRQRSQLVAGMARQAAALARASGHNVSESVLREVEATLEAALGDPAAAEAVRTGCLVRSLQRTGMDAVDLEGAVSGPTPGGRRERPDDGGGRGTGAKPGATAGDADELGPRRAAREQARQEAERERVRKQIEAARSDVEQAHQRWEEARAARDQAAAYLESSSAERRSADALVEDLEQQLSDARRAADDAAAAERRAKRGAADAEGDVESAQQALERAQAVLGRLQSEE